MSSCLLHRGGGWGQLRWTGCLPLNVEMKRWANSSTGFPTNVSASTWSKSRFNRLNCWGVFDKLIIGRGDVVLKTHTQTPLSPPLLLFTPPLSFCVALWKRNCTLYWNGFNVVVSHRCFAATFDHWPQQFHSETLATWLYSFCVTGDKKWLMRSTHHVTQTHTLRALVWSVLTGRSSWVITSSQPTDPFWMPGTYTKEKNHSELVTSVSGLCMEKRESAVGGTGWKALIICSSYWGFNDSTTAVEPTAFFPLSRLFPDACISL